MHLKEEEVAQLRQELHSIDVNIANTAEEKRRMRLAYEEKLGKITGQLKVLKRQQRDQEEGFSVGSGRFWHNLDLAPVFPDPEAVTTYQEAWITVDHMPNISNTPGSE